MAELVQYYGTGRRKTAIARVYLRPGSGDFKVNGRAFEEYFVTPAQRSAAKAPLASTDTAVSFNVIANVLGGGVRGQADAVKLGIARALMQFNAELRKKLKTEGMVTRDSRGKERKKTVPVLEALVRRDVACNVLRAKPRFLRLSRSLGGRNDKALDFDSGF